jgi:hypothetical protein
LRVGNTMDGFTHGTANLTGIVIPFGCGIGDTHLIAISFVLPFVLAHTPHRADSPIMNLNLLGHVNSLIHSSLSCR